MRVLFAGGKNVGCACLDTLIADPFFELVGVVINPLSDVSKNRWYRSAAEIAIKNNIPLFYPKFINSVSFIRVVENLSPDIIIVVYYDGILKKELIRVPPKGCINLHMGLAEQYRGCYPTTWAIVNGEEYAGVTIHYIDESIDGGDIIAQKKVHINESDTGKVLYDKCTRVALDLFKEVLNQLKLDRVSCKKQVSSKRTKYYTRKDFPSFEIDLSESESTIKNKIRALTFEPFPKPYILIGNRKFSVVEVFDG